LGNPGARDGGGAADRHFQHARGDQNMFRLPGSSQLPICTIGKSSSNFSQDCEDNYLELHGIRETMNFEGMVRIEGCRRFPAHTMDLIGGSPAVLIA
jgi:hypothetical protein